MHAMRPHTRSSPQTACCAATSREMVRVAACEACLAPLHGLAHARAQGVCPRLAQSQERCTTQPHHGEEVAHRSMAALAVSRATSAWPSRPVYNTSQHPCAYGDTLSLPQPYETVTRPGSRGCTSVWPQQPITCASSWCRSASIPWTPAAALGQRPLPMWSATQNSDALVT